MDTIYLIVNTDNRPITWHQEEGVAVEFMQKSKYLKCVPARKAGGEMRISPDDFVGKHLFKVTVKDGEIVKPSRVLWQQGLSLGEWVEGKNKFIYYFWARDFLQAQAKAFDLLDKLNEATSRD